MRECADCGHELENPSDTCPLCGSTRHRIYVTAVSTIGITSSVNDLELTYGPDRPWSSQWHNVQEHLNEVEAASQPQTYRGGTPLRRAFENFFTQCFHFGDWLWEDTTLGLTEKEVRTFIDGHPALRICAGLANTSKHRVRRNPNALTAVIASVRSSEPSVTARVSWTAGPDSGSEDALDLARRSVAAWDSFLQARGLQPPDL